MSFHARHYALGPDEGEAVWFLGALGTIKAGRTRGADSFAIVEFMLPAGFAPPPHIHHMEDEAFYILEGTATGTCGDDRWDAAPGSFIWLPRGLAHGFKVGEASPLKVFQITAPAGFDEFVTRSGEPAASRTLPQPSRPDIEKLNAEAARLGIEHLGRPPD